MELLSPAGSPDKLRYAYLYGADAAYIGLPYFSLRTRAENINDALENAPEDLRAIKAAFPGRKLYCAVNIYFHDDDIAALEAALPRLAEYPFDAFIVSDLGAYDLLRNRFPEGEFHLSTQANCTNPRAAKVFHDMGFSRIVPGRELSLDEFKAIKDAVPELEVEAFIHGAMCMAYSGRCFISSWLTDRSANLGDCTHSCRWKYRVAIEEEKRPGTWIPVESGNTTHGAYTLVMSSKDMCMVDRLAELKAAGIDSVKIEGRMKSIYYTALVTRAYRFAIDNPGKENPYRDDLFSMSHREYDTGFFFGREGMDVSTDRSYGQKLLFIGSTEAAPPLTDTEGNPVDEGILVHRFSDPGWTEAKYVDIRNTVEPGEPLIITAPGIPAISLAAGDYRFFDVEAEFQERIRHGKPWFIQLRSNLVPQGNFGSGWLIASKRSGGT